MIQGSDHPQQCAESYRGQGESLCRPPPVVPAGDEQADQTAGKEEERPRLGSGNGNGTGIPTERRHLDPVSLGDAPDQVCALAVVEGTLIVIEPVGCIVDTREVKAPGNGVASINRETGLGAGRIEIGGVATVFVEIERSQVERTSPEAALVRSVEAAHGVRDLVFDSAFEVKGALACP